ncbi:MAG: hypothetical protein COB10_11115 [Planctomycetota bacterium]|jgi:hypothetical protein|nr:MAG: hypothetical protein COB10_11115 [Planctomycetota bacterium]
MATFDRYRDVDRIVGDDDLLVKKAFKALHHEDKWIKKIKKIEALVDDLGWEHQRMSNCGKESYVELCKELGWKFDDGLYEGTK